MVTFPKGERCRVLRVPPFLRTQIPTFAIINPAPLIRRHSVGLDLGVNVEACGLIRRAILVFVWYPEPGRVKTDLRRLSPQRAAELHRQLVSEVFARCREMWR